MNKDKQLSSIVSRFFIAAIAGLHCAAACSFAADKPNVIFILADDLGYGDVPAFNPESKISMPNIDRLAKEGMRFTDAHAPGSICVPTRYGLLTGRYPFRTWSRKTRSATRRY